VWRSEPNFQIGGDDFPDPPASLALILTSSQTGMQTRNAKVAELEIGGTDAVISGMKTVQVEVKE
jgi:hypothetical protein